MKLITWLAVIWLIPGFAFAGSLSAEIQVKLQTAMMTHIDAVVVDGAYTYVDTENDRLATVYPANVHPFVLAVGDDYFVCSEMISEAGDTVTADFLVRNIGGSYRVVQMIINDREAVEGAIKHAGD